jgi:large subunit ribosomal protein L1
MTKKIIMNKHSRRYREIKSQIPAGKYFSLSEGLSFLQKNNREKSKKIKVSFALNSRKKKLTFNSKIIFPCPVASEKKIAVLNEELPVDLATSLRENNQVELLTSEELQKKTAGRKKSQWGFEKLLVYPTAEKKIKPLEKILAPRGLYPNKKNGNLTENIKEEIAKFEAGEKEIKPDKIGNVNLIIGRSDFTAEQLAANYKSICNKLIELCGGGRKDQVFNHITLSTIMGPGVKILI